MKTSFFRKSAAGTLLALFLSQGSTFAQCSAAGSHFTENYASSTGWTFSDELPVGGTETNCNTTGNGVLNIAGGSSNFVTARGGRELRMYKSIPTLSNDHWTAEFTFTLNAPPAGGLINNCPSAYLFAATAGTSPIRTSCGGAGFPTTCGTYPGTNMDGIWVLIGAAAPGNCTSSTNSTGWYFMAQSRNDNGVINSSNTIALTAANTYYIRLQRTWHSQGVLAVYSDPTHTTLVGSACFDIDPNVTGLNTIQHGIVEQGAHFRILSASMSNLRIDNDVTCPLSLTPSFTYPSVVCNGNPITVNGTASTGTPEQEAHYFWAIAECDAGGVITPGTEWSHWYDGQAGLYTFPSAANGGPTITCGKYYSIKLAIQNCGNVWSEVSHVIYVRCGPKVAYEEPSPICQGQTVTLSVTGNAVDYVWTPGNIHSSSITVTPGATTAYTVTGYDAYGCSTYVTLNQEVVPSLLDVNLSTGINDLTAGMIAVGQDDDTWKLRGVPGNLNAGTHASLPYTKVVSPYSGTYGNWYTSANVRWISSQCDGSGNPQEVPASQTDNTYIADNYHYFVAEANIHQKYGNLRIEASELAVDNEVWFYVNAGIPNGWPEYYLPGPSPTNYTTVHNPGTIATTQSLYHTGINTFVVKVINGGGPIWNGSYMGFLFKARLKGECDPLKMLVIEPQEENAIAASEALKADVVIFPTPNNGQFAVSTPSSLKELLITDITGRVVKTMNNINQTKTDIDLTGEDAGIYLVKAWVEGSTKPIVKKVIVNK